MDRTINKTHPFRTPHHHTTTVTVACWASLSRRCTKQQIQYIQGTAFYFYFFNDFCSNELSGSSRHSFSRPSTLRSVAVQAELQLRVGSELATLLDQVRQVDFALLHLLEKSKIKRRSSSKLLAWESGYVRPKETF